MSVPRRGGDPHPLGRAPYECTAHEGEARKAGLTDEDLDERRPGLTDEGLDERRPRVVAHAHATTRGRRVPQTPLGAPRGDADEAGLVQPGATVAPYKMTSRFLGALDAELPAGG
ncbi:hypothetical protein ACIPSE_29345 [Streptomyces sp. NPDC090106]|uniref:hypothetical protein n=1 Tax=Streptomyces sp. NPDC090106 TaxID=3365946 RepID=UPI00382B3F5B